MTSDPLSYQGSVAHQPLSVNSTPPHPSMPLMEDDQLQADSADQPGLPFPPVTCSHILNCSYHNWYPRYVIPCAAVSN